MALEKYLAVMRRWLRVEMVRGAKAVAALPHSKEGELLFAFALGTCFFAVGALRFVPVFLTAEVERRRCVVVDDGQEQRATG